MSDNILYMFDDESTSFALHNSDGYLSYWISRIGPGHGRYERVEKIGCIFSREEADAIVLAKVGLGEWI